MKQGAIKCYLAVLFLHQSRLGHDPYQKYDDFALGLVEAPESGADEPVPLLVPQDPYFRQQIEVVLKRALKVFPVARFVHQNYLQQRLTHLSNKKEGNS